MERSIKEFKGKATGQSRVRLPHLTLEKTIILRNRPLLSKLTDADLDVSRASASHALHSSNVRVGNEAGMHVYDSPKLR